MKINPAASFIASLVFAMIALGAVPALAQGVEELSIDWDSDDGCGSESSLRQELAKTIGGEWQGSVSQSFRGGATRREEGWSARLEATGDGETFSRAIAVGSCETAVKVVALLIALTLDPVLALSSWEPEIVSIVKNSDAEQGESEREENEEEALTLTAPEPKVESKTVEDENPVDKPAPDRPASEDKPEVLEIKGGAGAAFVADVGSVPKFGPGVAVVGALFWGVLRVDASVDYLPPRVTDISGSDGGAIRAQALRSSLGGGLAFELPGFNASAVAGLALNNIWADSKGIVETSKGAASYWSAWLSVALEKRLFERLSLRLAPGMHIPFSRPRFEIAGIGLVHQPSALSARVELGIFYVF